MKGLLFASFGTSYDDARVNNIDAVASFLDSQLTEYEIAQAYTSNMVRAILAKRGVEIPDVCGALRQLADKGVTEVFIQPGHLLLGEEFEKVCDQAFEMADLFEEVTVGDPVMASTQDVADLAEILSRQFPQQENTAVVFMGHGTPQFANVVYAALNYHLQVLDRDDMYVGTVEAFPELDIVMKLVEKKPYKNVILSPLMLVAGDHAMNDMAGKDKDSWAATFKAAGYDVVCKTVGLGALPEVQQMYLDHIHRVLEEENIA